MQRYLDCFLPYHAPHGFSPYLNPIPAGGLGGLHNSNSIGLEAVEIFWLFLNTHSAFPKYP